jgi:hypothetical protein
MKLICEPISVVCEGERPIAGRVEPLPKLVKWGGKSYVVQAVTATWRWRGDWWGTLALRGRERTYYRVVCARRGHDETGMDIYRESDDWIISCVLD